MGWAAEAFQESTNLEHHESLRVFLFILKSVSAITYIYVLGYLAAGGILDTMVWLILVLGALFDLVPETLTIRSMNLLPQTAQQAEKTHLSLSALAYILLAVTLFGGTSFSPFLGYASFAVIWITAFLIQESVFLFLDTPE